MIDEDKAFIDAYLNCMGYSSKEVVEDIIKCHNDKDVDEEALYQKYSYEYTNVIDAYLLWHKAIRFSINTLNPMRTA